MRYLGNMFVSIDQLGNVLAGGNPDNTISSRVGYYTNPEREKIGMHWTVFKEIINAAFYPIDGDNHCLEAYFNDAGEEFDEETSDLAIAALTIIIIPSCVIIGILLYLLYALQIVSPKKIDRNKNIKKRLKVAEAKLNGALTELNRHKVVVDPELEQELDKTKDTLDLICQKIEGILGLKSRLKRFKNTKDSDAQK